MRFFQLLAAMPGLSNWIDSAKNRTDLPNVNGRRVDGLAVRGKQVWGHGAESERRVAGPVW